MDLSNMIAEKRGIWQFHYLGLFYEEDELSSPWALDGYRNLYWILPYRMIVIPLTIISAVLLLSKPRQSKSKSFVEPAVAAAE